MKRFGMGKAKELFCHAFGTSKGIQYLDGRKPDEYGSGYEMQLGELLIRAAHTATEPTVTVQVIATCLPSSITMVFDAETYERNAWKEESVFRQHRKDLFHDWVVTNSIERCTQAIKKVWEECS